VTSRISAQHGGARSLAGGSDSGVKEASALEKQAWRTVFAAENRVLKALGC
jgi:hypothetical protein